MNDVFRNTYKVMSAHEFHSITIIKDKAQELYDLIQMTRPSREQEISFTKLEESIMWAVKGITE